MTNRFLLLMGLVALSAAIPAAQPAPRRMASAQPAEVSVDAGRLGQIDQIVAEGLEAKQMCGCVVLVGRRGKVVFLRAYGQRQIEPDRVEMTTDTVFDLASLTKPVATATSVMILMERGSLRLEDRVAKHIPEFGQNGKEDVTVFQLLTHQGGIVPDNPLADYADGPEKAWQRIFALKPRVPPGSKFLYSDVGYLVLGELVRRVSGKNVHEFSRDNIFRPLGMDETGYLPEENLRRRAAPTEKRAGAWIQGEVHDPRAYMLGGIAGHAGVFSTAEDLAVYAQMMLNGGQIDGVRILKQETVAAMTRPYQVSGGVRGLAWDIQTGYSSNRGRSFSSRAFGHGGFTGTVIWMDPELELLVIFLSSRLHPDGKGSVNPLAGRIGTVAADAIRDRTAPAAGGQGPGVRGQEVRMQNAECRMQNAVDADLHQSSIINQQSAISNQQSSISIQHSASPRVLTGIDVLRRDGFRLLAGRRVGLITNQTGVDRQGVSTARLLKASSAEFVGEFWLWEGSQCVI